MNSCLQAVRFATIFPWQTVDHQRWRLLQGMGVVLGAVATLLIALLPAAAQEVTSMISRTPPIR